MDKFWVRKLLVEEDLHGTTFGIDCCMLLLFYNQSNALQLV